MAASPYYFLMVLLLLLWWFLTLLVHGVFCDANGGSSGCIAVEREALLQFKLGLHDPQGNLRTWTNTTGDDCCRGWRGVGCDNQTGHVVELNLRGMNLNLAGVRGCKNLHEPTLCHLTRLRCLDFSSNNFNNCTVPSFLGCFAELRYLNLSTSCFQGVVPSSLGNLSNLVQLDLSKNTSRFYYFSKSFQVSPYLKIHDARWFRQLHSLEYIDMSYTQIGNSSSHWIQSLSELSSLSTLICHFCDMKAFIPTFIGNLSSLQKLDLSMNKLNGSIPISIGKLSSLENLDLSCNKLNGLIPTFLGNLTLLQSLDLSCNKLNGLIPMFLGNLTSLQSLHLSRNNFVGSIPIFLGNLMSLQSLDLSRNNFIGSIPIFLGNLSSLKDLELSRNNLNGSIPQSLCNLSLLENFNVLENDNINGANFPKCFRELTKLSRLYLGGHGYNLSESHFVNMIQLKSLYLKSNSSSTFHVSSSNWVPPFSLGRLSIKLWRVEPNEFPTWIHSQKELYLLYLCNVGITGSLPAWIWNLSSSLTELDVSSNDMDGGIPNVTNSNNKLRKINLSSNKFEGSKWLSSISNMTSTLKYLSLSNNTNLFGSIPSSLCEVKDLRVLDLSKNKFFGEIPDCIMKVKEILHLESNRFNGTFPMIREHQTCTLKALHLENNQLVGSLPSSLGKCSNLAILDLSGNKFTGSIPSSTIESMKSLLILRLRSNKLYGNIPQSLSRLESLQVLDLGNNNLSRSIPKTIGDLKAMMIVNKSKESITSDNYYYKESATIRMKGRAYAYIDKILSLVTSIDLSNNNLSGVIPQEFGDLRDLQNLNLAGNHLTSSIPKTLGRFLKLEALDLSRNELSGQIPQEMTKVTTLSHLNMSFNNLSGRIPTSKQFSTFTNESYIDNPNLCGLPLSKSCEEEQNPKSKNDQNRDDEDDKEKLWFYMTAVFGFIVGFWTFFGILFFKKTWRYSYLQFLNDTSEVLYMRIIQPIKRMVK